MCGILALFGEEVDVPSYLLSHRGLMIIEVNPWVNVVWTFIVSQSMT